MYTEDVVRLRVGGVLMALLVAFAPTASVYCTLTCHEPPVQAQSSPCHEPPAGGGYAAVRGHDHDCGQTHITMPAALEKANAGRVGAPFIGTASLDRADALSFAASNNGSFGAHGPPGSNSFRSNTIAPLRI